MIIDRQNHFNFGGQAVTVSAPSTDTIDGGVAGLSYGPGSNFLATRVGTAFASAGASTLNVSIQTSDSAAFTTFDTVYDSGAIAKAALVANATVQVVDLCALRFKRYVRVFYTVGTGPFTAGTVESFITPDVRV